MDQVLQFIYLILPFLHAIAIIVICVKALNVFSNKGFDLPGFVISFFRIYTSRDWAISSNKRRVQYMTINNYTNYYIYTWLFITGVIFLLYGDFGFRKY